MLSAPSGNAPRDRVEDGSAFRSLTWPRGHRTEAGRHGGMRRHGCHADPRLGEDAGVSPRIRTRAPRRAPSPRMPRRERAARRRERRAMTGTGRWIRCPRGAGAYDKAMPLQDRRLPFRLHVARSRRRWTGRPRRAWTGACIRAGSHAGWHVRNAARRGSRGAPPCTAVRRPRSRPRCRTRSSRRSRRSRRTRSAWSRGSAPRSRTGRARSCARPRPPRGRARSGTARR